MMNSNTRQFLTLAIAALLALSLGACEGSSSTTMHRRTVHKDNWWRATTSSWATLKKGTSSIATTETNIGKATKQPHNSHKRRNKHGRRRRRARMNNGEVINRGCFRIIDCWVFMWTNKHLRFMNRRKGSWRTRFSCPFVCRVFGLTHTCLRYTNQTEHFYCLHTTYHLQSILKLSCTSPSTKIDPPRAHINRVLLILHRLRQFQVLWALVATAHMFDVVVTLSTKG